MSEVTPGAAAPASTSAAINATMPAAAPTTPAAVAPAPTTPAADPNAWMSSLNDEQKGFITNKGFKGPNDILDSYRNLEKAMGVPQERLVKLPERMYDDKGVLTAEGRAIQERFGAPKEAKGYELDKLMPKEGGDPKLAEAAASWFHEAGITKSQAEKFVQKWNEHQSGTSEAMKAQNQAAFTQQENLLKTEWGAAFEQNNNIAKEAVRTLGLKAEQIDAIAQQLGHSETMKLFHKLGKSVGEMPFVNGKGTSSIMEPGTAKARIAELRTDPSFAKRLSNNEADAKALWQSLHQQAYPGMAVNT